MSGLDFKEFHWMASMINSIDAGMVVLDNDYNIKIWNGFMEHHSNIDSADAKGQNLFSLFPQLPQQWFKRKIEAVKTIQNQSFITWQQRDYLFKFNNYRPITGTVEFMYQNVTIIPLMSLTGQIEQISLIIYDVTDSATKSLQLQDANARLEQLSRTDPVTTLFNRQHVNTHLSRSHQQFNDEKLVTSLVLLDIDSFKAINDQYGYQAGNAVLLDIATIIKKSLRNNDICGRYGDDEFAILLHDTTGEQSKSYIERIQQQIEYSKITYQHQQIKTTVSFGIAETTNQHSKLQQWLNDAEATLALAQRTGKNQGRIYQMPVSISC